MSRYASLPRIDCAALLATLDASDGAETELLGWEDYTAWLEAQVRALAAHHTQFTREDVDLLRAFTATDDTRLPQNWLGAGRTLIAKLDAMLPPKPPEKRNG